MKTSERDGKRRNALKRRRRKTCRRIIDAHLTAYRPEPWDEDTTQPKKVLYLEGNSYRMKPLFDLPAVWSGELGVHYSMSPDGTFAYQNRVLPRHCPMPLLEPKHGLFVFSGSVAIPTLLGMDRDGQGKRLAANMPERERIRKAHVWMSLMPMEMLTQRSGVEAARGTVVIGGLGLGWLLRKVCEKEAVDRVVVVEWSQELLDWYGYDMCRKHSKVTDVICDDVYNQLGRYGDHATYVLDIWPIYQGANDDRWLRAAKQQYGDRLWAWGWKG